MRKIEKGHSYLLTQAMRAASRGVSRSKIAQRISSGRTRRSPRASVLRSLWLCCVWASIIKCQFQFLVFRCCAELNIFIHNIIRSYAALNRVFVFFFYFFLKRFRPVFVILTPPQLAWGYIFLPTVITATCYLLNYPFSM